MPCLHPFVALLIKRSPSRILFRYQDFIKYYDASLTNVQTAGAMTPFLNTHPLGSVLSLRRFSQCACPTRLPSHYHYMLSCRSLSQQFFASQTTCGLSSIIYHSILQQFSTRHGPSGLGLKCKQRGPRIVRGCAAHTCSATSC